ncbi:MAG: hypothetical protein KDA70_12375, partial [Planctomycetaceae bacterium]|nr:hypothetical protein [Planctomycetaceae bacterium]
MSEVISDQSYRAKPWFILVPVVVMVFWVGAGIFLANYFYLKTGSYTSKSVLAALAGSALMTLLTASGILPALAFWRRFQLTLSPQVITQVTGPETHTLLLDEITDLNWLSMSDEIILNSPTDKLRINLDHFKRKDQHAIIVFLREAVPVEKQEKWEPFSEVRRHSIDPDMPLTHWERFVTGVWITATGLAGFIWWRESEMIYLILIPAFVFSAIRSYRGT